jgi:hypothetical protein
VESVRCSRSRAETSWPVTPLTSDAGSSLSALTKLALHRAKAEASLLVSWRASDKITTAVGTSTLSRQVSSSPSIVSHDLANDLDIRKNIARQFSEELLRTSMHGSREFTKPQCKLVGVRRSFPDQRRVPLLPCQKGRYL